MLTADANALSIWVRNLQGPANRGLALLFVSAFGLAGCSGDDGADEVEPASGGSSGLPATGGAPSAGAGGSGLTGGAGAASAGTAGMTSAGAPGSGGAGTGGVSGNSGVAGSPAGASGAGSSSGGQPNAGAAGSAGSSGAGGAAAGAGGSAGSGGSAGAATAGMAGIAGMAGAPDLESCKSAPVPTPPADMQETIDITWDEMTGEFSGMTGARGNNRAIQVYPSWTLDHVMWSGGELNFCVRWDSDEPVTEALRDQVESALDRGVNSWFSALVGYDCFPYPEVRVKVTGWAVRDRATLLWSDDTIVPVYVNQLSEGAPTCPSACSRFSHQDPNYEFASCAAGPENRFDQFVWLEEDYDAPNGWDMGCHLNREDFTDIAAAGTGLYHIWLHEFGHAIGFPDYYDWDVWAPGVDAPRCVMNAGAAASVTDWDKWMFKRTWSELLRDDRWM